MSVKEKERLNFRYFIYLSFAQVFHKLCPFFDDTIDATIEEDEKDGGEDVDEDD